jgi:hypothetical protein
VTTAAVPGEPDKQAAIRPRGQYESPRIAYLGTLRELTLGGTTGPNDGVGGAGDVGSVP